jgi:DNA polymerase III epsilon subunit-like protein
MREELIPMNNTIDHRHIYGICLDTETANTIDDETGLNMRDVLFYDLGFQVVDSHGRTYGKKFSFVNADIFIHEKELMKSAYYAKKIPQYRADIASGKRILATTNTIRKILCQVIKDYDCKFVCAHNARFDQRALNNTQRWVTKSKYRYFLPMGLEWWDTLKMARSVMGNMPTYRDFCEENGYLTKNGRLRFTAEICYRFITKDNSFVESHTGLEDVEIETEILRYCHRQHKAMKKKLWGN